MFRQLNNISIYTIINLRKQFSENLFWPQLYEDRENTLEFQPHDKN